MAPIGFLFVILGIAALASGPAAFILVLTLLNRVNKLERQLPPSPPRPSVPPTVPTPQPSPVEPPTAAMRSARPMVPPPAAPRPTAGRPQIGLEQKIGTTVALIAGVITLIVCAAFFLKYMYDQAWFGPTTRVLLVAAGGVVALAVGEITRRRDYEIVAKGVTALGFALLYTAVFSASRVYMLIEMQTAFVLAIAITAGAMAYAVLLNEVAIALLSLLGGYLSPVIISTGQNLAMPLFSYLLALAVGAAGCALFRRWRAVHWMAMAGTYLLYTGWFETFYSPPQMTLALVWLGVFGGLFLVLPVVYGLLRKIAARGEDVGLIVANSVVVFYYLWRILGADYPQSQALAAAGVGAAHLVLMAAAALRCRQDTSLQAALGVLGVSFLTIAIPLYFAALNATLLSWSVEAVALTFIGIRYRRIWIKALALVVTAIAAAGLFYHLPLHTGTFLAVINAPFGTWMAVTAAILICHLLWRWLSEAQDKDGKRIVEIYYILGILLAALGVGLEWYAHCRWNIGVENTDAIFFQGAAVLPTVLMLVFLLRPLPPKGELVQTLGVLTVMGAAVFVVAARPEMHADAFVPVWNIPFAVSAALIAAMVIGAAALRPKTTLPQKESSPLSELIVLVGLLTVWVVLSQEVYLYWQLQNRYAGPVENWRFSAQMVMSMVWAVYGAALMIGGVVFKSPAVRYMSLVLFAVLLAKIFIKDTIDLRIEYRIAAFLTTGLVLVGVSFLYQYLKKKGFFETVSSSGD